eukprot:gene8235-11157_t
MLSRFRSKLLHLGLLATLALAPALPAQTPAAPATPPPPKEPTMEQRVADLDAMDRRYLRRMAEHHGGGPVGVETLSAALAEARDTLEDVIEPYLIQEGFLLRTSRGRMLAERGWKHLGLVPPAGVQKQLELGADEP